MCRYLVKDFGTSKSPKSTRQRDSRYALTVLRSSRFRIAHAQQAACALLHHDDHNDSTAFRMRSLYALHRSLSVAIPAIQPRLRLSGTNRLRFALHGGQRVNVDGVIDKAVRKSLNNFLSQWLQNCIDQGHRFAD